jgi:GNAT superfamily N-acetyltransferase
MGVVKVAALSVAESARNRGVGGALLSRVRRIYFQHGYVYVNGQMPNRPVYPSSTGGKGSR